MNAEPNKPTSALGLGLAGLRSKLERLRKDLSGLEERLYGLLCELEELVKSSGTTPSHATQELPPHPTDPSGALPERRRLMQQQASLVAISVKITSLSGGSALVQIDGRSTLQLSPAVAALFQVLKADFGSNPDTIVGWKSMADLKPALAKRMGGAFSDQAVKELIYRLRRVLEKHGENPFLLQNNRKLGYRLAVRRGGDL